MKVMNFFGLIAMMALVCVGLNSCSGGYSKENAEEMLKKYEDGKMTEADFTTCIEWSEDYMNEGIKEMESAIEKADNKKDLDKTMEDVEAKLKEKYPNMEDIISMLEEAAANNDKTMGEKNIERWKKSQEEFLKKIKDLMGKAMGSALSE